MFDNCPGEWGGGVFVPFEQGGGESVGQMFSGKMFYSHPVISLRLLIDSLRHKGEVEWGGRRVRYYSLLFLLIETYVFTCTWVVHAISEIFSYFRC